jgi:hypothetical protein
MLPSSRRHLRVTGSAQFNTHLLELEVVGDNGEGKADTMEVDTIPGRGGGGDKALPWSSPLSGRGQ